MLDVSCSQEVCSTGLLGTADAICILNMKAVGNPYLHLSELCGVGKSSLHSCQSITRRVNSTRVEILKSVCCYSRFMVAYDNNHLPTEQAQIFSSEVYSPGYSLVGISNEIC